MKVCVWQLWIMHSFRILLPDMCKSISLRIFSGRGTLFLSSLSISLTLCSFKWKQLGLNSYILYTVTHDLHLDMYLSN